MTLRAALQLFVFLAMLSLLSACAHPHGATGSSVTSAIARAALADPKHDLWRQSAPEVFRVRVDTSRGPFVVEARRDWAPHGVDRLYNLVRAGYYDDSRFFRVDARYIVQFGIAGNPAISKIWRHETIPDDERKQSNLRGTIGFASPTNANSCTTQLYINLGDNSRNDPVNFAIIGHIVEGMDVVDALYSGYGENSGGGIRAGRQDRLFEEGNAWLDRDFPRLDKLIRATVYLTIEDP
jgi:homoserine O-acetyltransferase